MQITIGIGGSKQKNIRENKGKSIIDFPSDYVLFDIETTGLDPNFDEIIEIGAIRVRDLKIVDKFHTLVKPEYEIDDFIVDLTGITNEMVENAPSIQKILPSFIDFIGDDILVGHNINFDINFIYDNLINCDYLPLTNDFVDTLRLSRRILPELEHHRLIDLADYYNIDTKGNHRSMKDVEITNSIYINLKNSLLKTFDNVDDFINSCRKKTYTNIKFSEIKATVTDINEENPFFGKCVAITGKLERMQRKEAMQLIANLGANCQDGVNKETNFLILGNNDYNPILRGNKSSKLIKAENMKLKGKDIEIISENIFYDILDDYNIK